MTWKIEELLCSDGHLDQTRNLALCGMKVVHKSHRIRAERKTDTPQAQKLAGFLDSPLARSLQLGPGCSSPNPHALGDGGLGVLFERSTRSK
jgi:hypothetical protein